MKTFYPGNQKLPPSTVLGGKLGFQTFFTLLMYPSNPQWKVAKFIHIADIQLIFLLVWVKNYQKVFTNGMEQPLIIFIILIKLPFKIIYSLILDTMESRCSTEILIMTSWIMLWLGFRNNLFGCCGISRFCQTGCLWTGGRFNISVVNNVIHWIL